MTKRRDTGELMREFLAQRRLAVVGASNDRSKFGHKVLAACLRHGRDAVPVNPRERAVLGVPCVASLRDLAAPVAAASIVTPPEATERVVEDAAAAKLALLWMQPGAESERAVARARELGLEVISGGPCLLVELDAER
jgi:predicted CoA-binding protein